MEKSEFDKLIKIIQDSAKDLKELLDKLEERDEHERTSKINEG